MRTKFVDERINREDEIMKRQVVYISLVLAVAGLAGCSSNSTSSKNPATGSYKVTISGDLDKTLSGGIAVFGSDSEDGESYFGIYIGTSDVNDTGAANTVTISRQGGQPSAGTYAITNADQSDSGDFFAAGVLNSTIPFVSASGTLTIDQIGDHEAKGDFTIQAQGYQVSGTIVDTLNIILKGSFDAISSLNAP